MNPRYRALLAMENKLPLAIVKVCTNNFTNRYETLVKNVCSSETAHQFDRTKTKTILTTICGQNSMKIKGISP